MSMTVCMKRTVGAAVAGLTLLAIVGLGWNTAVLRAQAPVTPGPGSTSAAPVTHEQMHQMMDAMHGEGTSERMHAAMGQDAERLMEQCAAMMAMMQGMQGTMGGGMMGGGMMGGGMPGMMGR